MKLHLRYALSTLTILATGCAPGDPPATAPPIERVAQAQTGDLLGPGLVLPGETPAEALSNLEIAVEVTAKAEQDEGAVTIEVGRRTLDPTVVLPPSWTVPPPAPDPRTTYVSADVAAWLVDGGDPGATRTVVITMPWLDDGQPGAHTMQMLAQLAGDPVDFDTARQDWGADRMNRIDTALNVWGAYAEAKGLGAWQAHPMAAPIAVADLTRVETQGVIDAQIANGVELASQLVEELDDGANRRTAGSSYMIDGLELRNLVQSGQFYSRGIEGDRHALVSEGGAHRLNKTHPGFTDANGARRLRNCSASSILRCNNAACNRTNMNAWNACSWHATGVTGVIAGDMTNGQQPAQSPAAAFSGIAREATIDGVDSIGTRALNLAAATDAIALNRSASNGLDCSAYQGLEENADALFDAGVGFFKSAGNMNNDNIPQASEADCNVGRPGRAGGVFTVGAYYLGPNEQPPADDPSTALREDVVQREGVAGRESSFGGTVAQGWNRTAVDIIAPTRHENRYLHEINDDDGDGQPEFFAPQMGATSGATPVATGIALLYRQWSDTVGGLAHFPGILYARMLLMGDGWDGLNTYLDTGFSPRSGAGRLRARAYDGIGLDAPFTTRAGFVCVDQGDVVTIDINDGEPLSSDIDVLKVVAWHTRSDRDGAAYFNRVFLSVRAFTNSFWQQQAADASGDNKKRVILDDADLLNAPYRIELVGFDISGTDPNCPAGGQRVYYALVAEDADREAHENLCAVRNEVPTTAPVPCGP